MGKIKIHANNVSTIAYNLRTYNNDMQDKFSAVRTSINQMNNCWDGSASLEAINKFNEIESKYRTVRYNEFNNCVKFLFEQVIEGYWQIEQDNISLADKFK